MTKRRDDETFEDYRIRRNNEEKTNNNYLKGSVLWPSKKYKTALNVKIKNKDCYISQDGKSYSTKDESI